MAETTQFELVTPERLVFSEAAEMVVVPGSEGLFAAMPRHAPFLSTLKPGVIEVYEGGKVIQRIFVAGGFAEVTPERLTVLAERAVLVADIDRPAVEQRIKNLRDDVAAAKSDAERIEAEAAIEVAQAELLAAA
jgi:F-type H+-transporting ATPase subunit epsilon